MGASGLKTGGALLAKRVGLRINGGSATLVGS